MELVRGANRSRLFEPVDRCVDAGWDEFSFGLVRGVGVIRGQIGGIGKGGPFCCRGSLLGL